MAETTKTVRWSDTTVTDTGTVLLADYAAGRVLNITGAYGSLCNPGEVPASMTDLPDGRSHPLTVESVTKTDNSVTVCVQVTSIGNAEAYKLEQIGLYAVTKDPGDDDTGGILYADQLFAVVADTEDENGSRGVTIPAESEQLYTFKLYIVITVSNTDRLEISISAAGIATMDAITEAVGEHDADVNAHAVAFAAHNADDQAHPALIARARATELALNGSETILGDGDPTDKTVGLTGQHYINLSTGTEWVCNGSDESGYLWEQILYDSGTYKSLRSVLEDAVTTAESAKEVADGAAQAIAAVQNTISVTPSQSGTLTYNSALQKPTWNNNAVEMLTITYGENRVSEAEFTGEINAGTYYAYATPNEGYSWGDKSNTERELTWTIGRAVIASVPAQSGSLTYSGEEQKPVLSNYDESKLTLGGTTAATNAGTYELTATPTANYQWSGGSTDTKSVQWTIGRASVDVPTQSGSLTYTGEAQSPTLDGYDAEKMTLGGVTSATAAGTYSESVTPTDNYQWPDGTTGAKAIEWTIAKAAGSLTLDKTTVKLNATAKFDTVTVTRSGTGAITAVSGDTDIATVSVSGATVLITAGGTNGTVTVTISVAEDGNYNAPVSQTVSVTVAVPKIYGVSWDGTSTTSMTRTDDAAGFVDPVPYVSGATSYSSPFDTLQPWAGMVKSERSGGTMVAIPKFWYKLAQNGAGMTIQIADQETDGFSVSPAHMDRGDGKGERDVVYIGRYHCGATAYKSVTGQSPKVNITRSAARSAISALGDTIWQTDFATRFTLWLLYIVEFANWNSQAKIGYGCGNGSAVQAMGASDSMPYHTGTMQTSRTTYGVGTQYRNIEGLWDNCLDWCDGCYYSSAGMSIILNPANFSDTANGTVVGTPTGGWPSAFTVKDVSGAFPLFIPTTSSGSDSTYSCDSWSFDASSPCLYAGGGYGRGTDCGLFYVSCSAASYSYAYFGSRLLELP